jgi:hypothetical protein
MSLGRGTHFDSLFAALTERMGVLHTAAPDTDPSQRDRVEWREPADGGIVKRGYRRTGGIFVGFLAVTFQVSVYGATEFETTERKNQLVGWLDYLVGPPQGAPGAGDGYAIGKSKPTTGGDGDAAGWASVTPVTLYLPVFQQIFGARDVASITITTAALNPDGSAPTGDTLNPLQASA